MQRLFRSPHLLEEVRINGRIHLRLNALFIKALLLTSRHARANRLLRNQNPRLHEKTLATAAPIFADTSRMLEIEGNRRPG